jgi:2-keto-4-pentenoate hydratase/2-oxohepta-3-ene-1,7-dioic acid hydratase in catechol pathway
MRIVRFTTQNNIKYGILENEFIMSLAESPFEKVFTPERPQFDRASYSLNEVKLLSPCTPSKIVCLGVNYLAHAQEFHNTALPSSPLIFLKPPTAVIGPEDKIVLPRSYNRVDFEGELAVVIGKKTRFVPEKDFADYILGYTCLNDVTERHIQKEDGQWTRAKGFDTFAPIGPWIETALKPDDLKIETYLNGEAKQSSRTSKLIFGVKKLVSFISEIMTLLPGDVIATGTPSGVGPMQPGDIVEVRIEKIGVLRNTVAATNT